ncbi:hypothetical protein M0R45_020672 [Rubus argutus]|uniref:Uncharacterized protein n=1 Tax=Rubus argutus TaxID=59490 RepID=A0AAW1XAY6_RUBAR
MHYGTFFLGITNVYVEFMVVGFGSKHQQPPPPSPQAMAFRTLPTCGQAKALTTRLRDSRPPRAHHSLQPLFSAKSTASSANNFHKPGQHHHQISSIKSPHQCASIASPHQSPPDAAAARVDLCPETRARARFTNNRCPHLKLCSTAATSRASLSPRFADFPMPSRCSQFSSPLPSIPPASTVIQQPVLFKAGCATMKPYSLPCLATVDSICHRRSLHQSRPAPCSSPLRCCS